MDLAVDLCVEKVNEHLSRPSKEVTASAAGPALANAALLLAEGCPRRYVAAIKALYKANHLPCPVMDIVFDIVLPAPVKTQHVDITSQNYHLEPVDVSTQTFDSDVTSTPLPDSQSGG